MEEERQYIREQIIVHQRLIFQIFTFSIIAAIAVLGWGIQDFPTTSETNGEKASLPHVFFLLAPLAITVPCAWVIKGIREDIFRWGAYILVFHESDRLGYEKLLDKARETKDVIKESYSATFFAYGMLTLLCSGLFCWGVVDSPNIHWGLCFVVVIPLIVQTCLSRIFFRIPSDRKRQEYQDNWREAQEALSQQAAS